MEEETIRLHRDGWDGETIRLPWQGCTAPQGPNLDNSNSTKGCFQGGSESRIQENALFKIKIRYTSLNGFSWILDLHLSDFWYETSRCDVLNMFCKSKLITKSRISLHLRRFGEEIVGRTISYTPNKLNLSPLKRNTGSSSPIIGARGGPELSKRHEN